MGVLTGDELASNVDEVVLVHFDTNFDEQESAKLKPLLDELQQQVTDDSIKPSTLKHIAELLATCGPAAATIVDFLGKISGLKP